MYPLYTQPSQRGEKDEVLEAMDSLAKDVIVFAGRAWYCTWHIQLVRGRGETRSVIPWYISESGAYKMFFCVLHLGTSHLVDISISPFLFQPNGTLSR